MGVMVVVPALAAGEQSYPETVARVVVGFKAALAPHVGCRVDQPGGVQAEGDAQQSAPQHHGNAVDPAAPDPSAGEEQRGAERDGKPVILAEPDMETVADEVGQVAGERLGLRVQRLAKYDPSGMRPPAAFARRVRVALMIAELVMHTMRGDPGDGPALEGERCADAHQIFQPLGNLIAAVREQAVIAHADAHVDGQHVEHGHDHKALPTEEKQRGQRARVEDAHDEEQGPAQACAHCGGAAHAKLALGGDGVHCARGRKTGILQPRHCDWSRFRTQIEIQGAER